MKKVYLVLQVWGQGMPGPLKAAGTGKRGIVYNESGDRDHSLSAALEVFGSREAADDRARELVKENPTQTYHVAESVAVHFSAIPVSTFTWDQR